ncbi:hypothetical protein MNBD_GAMMA09-1651 [hydrothermal vent metagenome]|uniref:BIG2 domain-containing protein n=1 Tax=hydrothermal vent metagenome TaxID=652676 RepID=A0A3B0Y1N6_9ZZZZ
MNFKHLYSLFIFTLLFILTACSDKENETALANAFTTADLDITAISFPAATTEDVISTSSIVNYTLEGLKSNGVDTISIAAKASWSLSDGALSTIDQNGALSSAGTRENITITATVGSLIATQSITVSAAKFDQVVQLSDTAVTINMCQAKPINPLGRYINDDGSPDEIRPVDNNIINTITWIILQQEDRAASQRAFIKTENNITHLQAFETGGVIIQAQAPSVYNNGAIVTSIDFNQQLDNNLRTVKLCPADTTNIIACTLSDKNIPENGVASVIAVADYDNTADGTVFYQNISAYSKWGIDNNINASLAFSTDRQQLDITGNTANTTANISAACGNIEQTVTDAQIKDGVILASPVTCANGNAGCKVITEAMTIIDNPITSLSITANNVTLQDNSSFAFNTKPGVITFNVTANYLNNNSQDVTSSASTRYTNNSTTIISARTLPGEYNVLQSGNAEVIIDFQNQTFTAKLSIPN